MRHIYNPILNWSSSEYILYISSIKARHSLIRTPHGVIRKAEKNIMQHSFDYGKGCTAIETTIDNYNQYCLSPKGFMDENVYYNGVHKTKVQWFLWH